MIDHLEAPESARSFVGNELRSNYEVWLISIREFLQLLPLCSPYLAEPFNPRETSNPREIVAHVILAAYGHFNRIAKELGIQYTPYETKNTIVRLNDVTTVEGFINEFQLLAAWVYDTLKDISEEALLLPAMEVWPKEWYAPVGLFEHSTVHVLRHHRQLKRMLSEKSSG